jgi:hypothetical protein
VFLGRAVYTSTILDDPEPMDHFEDPYIIVIEDPKFSLREYRHEDMASVITLLHGRGWETENISVYMPGRLIALLKNPRAKQKNVGES